MGKVSSRYWSDVYVGAPGGEDPCMGWCGCHAYHGASTIQCWKHARGCLSEDGVGMGSKRATDKGFPRGCGEVWMVRGLRFRHRKTSCIVHQRHRVSDIISDERFSEYDFWNLW